MLETGVRGVSGGHLAAFVTLPRGHDGRASARVDPHVLEARARTVSGRRRIAAGHVTLVIGHRVISCQSSHDTTLLEQRLIALMLLKGPD